MHAISSYRGNRPTTTASPPQTGPTTIHCATKLSAQCKYARFYLPVHRIREQRTFIIFSRSLHSSVTAYLPIFTIIGRGLLQLSFNTTASKWLITPKLCKYTTLQNTTMQNYGCTLQLLSCISVRRQNVQILAIISTKITIYTLYSKYASQLQHPHPRH